MKKLAVSLVMVGVFLAGCSDDKKESTAAVAQNAPVVVAQEEKAATVEKAKEEITAVAVQVQQNSAAAVEEVKKETASAVENVKTQAANATATVEQKVEEATQAIEEAALVNERGIELYAKCAACHGTNAEKKALGTSQVIKGWSVEQTISSLKGYKNKTYGGSMKTVMTSQVATLSDADIEALAQHIATF